ncbi:hypothetical protein SporoP37_12575 [Sporosarcina sp. P37]|uniref:hypothetical protein n=1 Tax=unclassified Sporosarcina TaxID=2647733 RepID=UPI0009C0D353|nr:MULTISPECIES: hypothetical protein [unclassified Sporosarcina]ARD48919.1 hypothetical protein SporoP33_12225 [Sporosarcina sp. P33]ARK25409.1 hypothetical protein SporoP37_12575 [Sporosarcina sp. P37]PID19038.1 hypothetical protein CSV62_05395 [Sporosarcina sp. P35]
MSSRKFRPCRHCDSSYIPARKMRCYDEKKIIHILADLTMGAPVEITLKDSKEFQHNGYYLQYDRKSYLVHFQPFGDPGVLEIDVSEICTIRYSS